MKNPFVRRKQLTPCQKCGKLRAYVDYRSYIIPMVDSKPVQSKVKMCDECHVKQENFNKFVIEQHNERVRLESKKGQQADVSTKG